MKRIKSISLFVLWIEDGIPKSGFETWHYEYETPFDRAKFDEWKANTAANTGRHIQDWRGAGDKPKSEV